MKQYLIEIDNLLENEYDWDDIGYIKPTPEAIDNAKSVFVGFAYSVADAGHTLTQPYISNFEEGGASIKWKIGDRTLYIEIGQDISICTKVYKLDGKFVANEDVLIKEDYVSLWEWLINDT